MLLFVSKYKVRYVVLIFSVFVSGLVFLLTMKFSWSVNLLSLVLPSQYLSVEAARYNGYSSAYSFDANYFHALTWVSLFPFSVFEVRKASLEILKADDELDDQPALKHESDIVVNSWDT